MRDEKPTSPKPEYAWDGVLSADYRLVRPCKKGGRVKAWGTWWEHEKLKPFVGKWVWVGAGEYWVVWITVYEFPYETDRIICTIGDR